MPRYAAIDIGSNSIRMLAAETGPKGEFRELASSRNVVRLGENVFREGRLSPVAMDLACQTLAAMAEEYRRLDVLAVRAVGTAALRDATNRAEFLARATQILGTPVEVISGLEEARLIHLGVQARWPQPKHRLVICDVGGGSAELILSEGGRMIDAFSRPLGAVRLTGMFLKSDPPDPRELARMEKHIQERIAGAVERIGTAPIERMVATSATAAAAFAPPMGCAAPSAPWRTGFWLRPRRSASSTTTRRIAIWPPAAASPASVPGAPRSSWPASRC